MTSSPVLLADVGGTHSRFGLVSGVGAPRGVRQLANDLYRDFSSAVHAYLAEAEMQPQEAVIAVACPVEGRRVALTNRDWAFDIDAFAAEHGFARVRVINDFVALAYALPDIPVQDLQPIGPARDLMDATKVVLGPGTGLGVSALLRGEAGWMPVPSEGGHVELAPVTPREFEIFSAVRARYGRVSAEIVISGPGLARLDAAIAEVNGRPHQMRDGAAIAEAARGGDAQARAAIALFWRLLARFAGDMAVTFVARGGVYVAGGVAQKLADFLDPAAFRAEFEAKAPHEALVGAMPTVLVTSEVPALIGCAALALAR